MPPRAAARDQDKLAKFQRFSRYVDFRVVPTFMLRAAGTPMDAMVYPAWVTNCGVKVVGALFPQIGAMGKDEVRASASRLGFGAGLMDAGQRLLVETLTPILPANLPQPTEEQQGQVFEFLYGGFAQDFKRKSDELVPVEMKDELATLESSLTFQQSVQYRRGYAEAQEMMAGKNKATETTRIYLTMLMLWQVVEVLPTIQHLEKILTKLLGRNLMGSDPKRLRQICGRIGKTFQRPGRPKKQPHAFGSVR